MTDINRTEREQFTYEEIPVKSFNGMTVLLISFLLYIASLFGFIRGIIVIENEPGNALAIAMIIASFLYLFIIGPILFIGLKIIKPNEAAVFTLFGKYYGTIRKEGFYFINPFVTSINPTISP